MSSKVNKQEAQPQQSVNVAAVANAKNFSPAEVAKLVAEKAANAQHIVHKEKLS
jgi:hypothetical protein